MWLIWYITNVVKRRWKRIWLSIFVLAILMYVVDVWLKPLYIVKDNNNNNDDATYSVNQRQFYGYWGKTRADADWLINYKKSRRTDPPIFVVEEHHEVLKYWFQAAELGITSKSRNVLVHIDGHSDAAYPEDVETIPWFRFPRNEEEIQNMMQRNDVFIAAATLTGLIDHVIWIWPSWMEEEEDPEESEGDDHEIYDNFIGYTRVKSVETGGFYNDLCFCVKQRFPKAEDEDDSEEWECRRKNKTSISYDESLPIEQSECLKQGEIVFEIVKEHLASKVLAEHKSKNILLDIDEDFFGCWTDAISLYDSGLTQENIDTLSDLVSYLFCVSTTEEEQLADRMYASLLSLVMTLKKNGCSYENREPGTRCLRNVEIENFMILRLEEVENFLFKHNYSQIMCEPGSKVRGLFLQSLMHFLLNFSVKQLDALIKLGICLTMSPPTLDFSNGAKFKVCHGDNIPGNSAVVFHLPNETEINVRTKSFKHILSSLNKSPDLVSICRSVRDGYTPKKYFNLIEQNVMQSLHSVYRQTHSDYVHYDENLFGGKVGWVSRKQPLISPLLDHMNL